MSLVILQKKWSKIGELGRVILKLFLIDYDVHSNYGNWNYLAGVGNDPRDRKFNIELQAKTTIIFMFFAIFG